MENSNTNMLQPSLSHHSRSSSDGPITILWDIENCSVPSDVRPKDVAGNIRIALWAHPVIKGAVMMFSAYGDFNAFPRLLREGCQRTGVKLIDVPNGRKDAADKAILVDMFLFSLDNPPPSSILLISGNVDFAPALHILGQRGYTVILVVPSGFGISSALTNAGEFVWDWPSMARGEGFVAPTKVLAPPHGGVVDKATVLENSIQRSAEISNKKKRRGPHESQTSKNKGSRKKRNDGGNLGQRQEHGNQATQGNQQRTRCPRCNWMHWGECRAEANLCFRCGKADHFVRDCPVPANNGNPDQQRGNNQ